jgi:hypothetical protein
MSEAMDKAVRRGWRGIVQPEQEYDAERDPHAWGEACNCKKLAQGRSVCPCNCHGYGGTYWLDRAAQ